MTPDDEAIPLDRPILVPVDFSAHSKAALLWATDAAERFEAPLCVLHVVHDPAEAPGSYLRPEDRHQASSLEEAADEMMSEFVDGFVTEHPDLAEPITHAARSLVVGVPVSRILEVARKTDARMIVMGSRGRTGLPHLLLGSKAERVVQLSPVPVVIVKAPQEVNGIEEAT